LVKHQKPINTSKILRPNKIKVLVLRQRRPLNISAAGTFLLPYSHAVFLKKNKFKFTAKSKLSSVPVTQTSFEKGLND
jgi:hypothetical protein